MEIVVAATTNFVIIGLLIGYATNLGRGSGGVLTRRNLSKSSRILIVITRVVGIPHMVFTNPIMTTHVNKTTDQPLMNSLVAGRYKSTDVRNLGGGYRKPFVVSARIIDNKNGHFMRPNMVVLKCLDFKKDVDPDAHVRMLNFAMKGNVKTFKKISSMHLIIH